MLDVGANVGVAAVFFAEECGAGAVHSFEPIEPLYDLLWENTRELPAVVPHRFGLYREACRLQMTYYPDSAAMSGLYADPEGDSALVQRSLVNLGRSREEAAAEVSGRYRAEQVEGELRRLSDVLRDRKIEQVDLLKVDVEGAELDVIAGIDDGDWDRIRQLAVEVHRDVALEEMERRLSERGFRVTTEQETALAGTSVRMLYAVRT